MKEKKGWKEVQKSIKLLREELKSAKEAFDNRENEAAKQAFEKCVEICRDNNCGTKQEMLEVYTGLADSCFALKDYQRAESAYADGEKLLLNQEAKADLIISLSVKRARALEWLNHIEEAEQLLASAVSLAQSQLAAGHLLISFTLDAYAALLRKYPFILTSTNGYSSSLPVFNAEAVEQRRSQLAQMQNKVIIVPARSQ